MAVRLVVRHWNSAAGDAGEARFEFDQTRVVIGRGAGAEVRLPGTSVSDTHAILEHEGGRYTIRDEGSTNGTRVNDKLLVARRPTPLDAGDEIAIAEFTLVFSEGPLSQAPTFPERTASLARRILGELLGSPSTASDPPFIRILEGPEQGTVLNFGPVPSKLRVGRGEDCDIVLTDLDVSRVHVELGRDVDGVIARDLHSKNGIDVNGRRVRERRLKHGDVLRIGGTALLYQDLAEQALRELEKQPDAPFTHTRPRFEPEPVPPRAAERELEPEDVPAPIEEARETGPVDLLIYALAVFVLVASAVGLVWLFR